MVWWVVVTFHNDAKHSTHAHARAGSDKSDTRPPAPLPVV